MSTTRSLIERRLSTVRDELNEILLRVDSTILGWAPADGMRTIAGQLIEIAGSEVQIVARVRDGVRVSDPEVCVRIGHTENLERLVEYLGEVRRETLGYLASLSDKQLDEQVELKGWHESMGLPEVPLSEAFRGIAHHEEYHIGQLVSYLWARGDNPYNW